MNVDYIEESSVRKALAFEIENEVVEKEIEDKARALARKAHPRLPPRQDPLIDTRQGAGVPGRSQNALFR